MIETAEWIDSFFDNPRSLAEENKTRGILRLEFKYSKENDFEFKPRFSLRMELPRLVQQTTQLVFSAAEDLDFDRDSNPLGYLSGNSGDGSGGFVTGVRQFLIEGEEYNIFVEGGIKWWKYAYGGVRFRDLRTFGDWQGRLTKVRYRQRFFRDWLVLEIAPQVFAREEDDYDAGVELIFKLEGSLGYTTDKDGYKRIFANRSAH